MKPSSRSVDMASNANATRTHGRTLRADGPGDRIVYDANAPEWWSLEDPAGNQADIAPADST